MVAKTISSRLAEIRRSFKERRKENKKQNENENHQVVESLDLSPVILKNKRTEPPILGRSVWDR